MVTIEGMNKSYEEINVDTLKKGETFILNGNLYMAITYSDATFDKMKYNCINLATGIRENIATISSNNIVNIKIYVE